MKVIGNVLWLIGAGFIALDGVYLVWSLQAGNLETNGLLTIGLSGVLCLFLAFYFSRVLRAGGPVLLPEDRMDADTDDGDPEMGFFSPHSWWPILLAAACGLIFLGLAVSAWIWMLSAPFLLVALVGWAFENYRGQFAH
ncbi:cytochrome c oxidase subunit 4 [Frigoribacterium sp. VKM Ac-2530]|uniref:aa3-type cytochrome oxidase subunit IV n=1 Tax=Frigoribacterium sp. VKM Ac-2530 TaxID=2783822 RepID=UPI00188AB186|nr:cytochrome c oxidase subunit 4 [Frigoribacterium sp. VKM Ac-2530]MBF4578426.1 cytochrome c oxidase subunit 4 [Frigoribacterium sp. VKM Ac-2530]